jgi:hypothetical protein
MLPKKEKYPFMYHLSLLDVVTIHQLLKNVLKIFEDWPLEHFSILTEENMFVVN